MRLGDLDALKEEFERLGYTYRVTNIIDNAPTVELATNLQPTCNNLQQRPQGEWIETDVLWETNCGGGMGYDYGYYFKCSVCDEMVGDKTNFCPNCGAQMLGGDKTWN